MIFRWQKLHVGPVARLVHNEMVKDGKWVKETRKRPFVSGCLWFDRVRFRWFGKLKDVESPTWAEAFESSSGAAWESVSTWCEIICIRTSHPDQERYVLMLQNTLCSPSCFHQTSVFDHYDAFPSWNSSGFTTWAGLLCTSEAPKCWWCMMGKCASCKLIGSSMWG